MSPLHARIYLEDSEGNLSGSLGEFVIENISANKANTVDIQIDRSFCKLVVQVEGASFDSVAVALNGRRAQVRVSPSGGSFAFALRQDLELHRIDLLVGATKYLGIDARVQHQYDFAASPKEEALRRPKWNVEQLVAEYSAISSYFAGVSEQDRRFTALVADPRLTSSGSRK
jgi:hypothetical protein